MKKFLFQSIGKLLKISKNMNKKIAIIGLGYVGLPLAIEFSKKYKVVAFDNNPKRIESKKALTLLKKLKKLEISQFFLQKIQMI